MTTQRKKKGVVEHHLLTIAVAPDVHMHCYLMSARRDDMMGAVNRMLHEAEKGGCNYPLMNMVLATPLVDDLEAVRAIVAARDAEAGRLLQQATNFHLSIWATHTSDPTDAQLLAMH